MRKKWRTLSRIQGFWKNDKINEVGLTRDSQILCREAKLWSATGVRNTSNIWPCFSQWYIFAGILHPRCQSTENLFVFSGWVSLRKKTSTIHRHSPDRWGCIQYSLFKLEQWIIRRAMVQAYIVRHDYTVPDILIHWYIQSKWNFIRKVGCWFFRGLDI